MLTTSSMLGLTLSVLTAPAAAPSPCTATELAENVRPDPPPEEVTRGLHYVNTDERRHDLFRAEIKDKGGIFVGVGSSQNYLMAPWAKPELLVVIDFDQVIIDLHRVYEIVFRNTDSPESFVAAWKSRNRGQVLHWIHDAVGKKKQRRTLKETFREYRQKVEWGLSKMRERMAEQDQPTFMNDAEQFAFIKKLFAEDRIFFVRGDFTGRKTLADLGKLAREKNLEVGVLYLSNVEQYFNWNRNRFRQNMLDLPLTDNSVVLRTYGFGERRAADHNYGYVVQTGSNFHAWVADQTTRSVKTLLESRQKTDTRGFFRLSLLPDTPADPGSQ